MVEMEDDGNCQFRALANELHGDERHHAGGIILRLSPSVALLGGGGDLPN